jgi:pentamidine resistance factor
MIRTVSRQIRLQSTAATDSVGLQKQLTENSNFRQLWRNKIVGDFKIEPNTNDDFNALTTLPADLYSREKIMKDVALQNPDLKEGSLKLKFRQNSAYVKKLLGFYKLGVKNVIQNRTRVKEIKERYYFENVESKAVVHKRKFRNSTDLLAKLLEIKSLRNIESEVNSKSNYLLNLKRSELQLVLRTERDFYKIPLFCLIVMVFFEMTPILCYFIPEITPSTCVLPSASQKLHSAQSKAFRELAKLRTQRYDEFYSKGQIPLRFNYENLPTDELLLLSKGLKLTSRYIPVGIYPEKYIRDKLHRKLIEFEIDNDYLLNQGGLWKLTKIEALKACLDRGLIDLEKYKNLEDLTSSELRLKLALQLILTNNNIIGNVNIYGLNYLNLKSAPSFRDYDREDTAKIETIQIEES